LAEEDTNKSGIPIEEADSFLHACLQYPHLKIEGIMVMGPHTDDSERIKFVFMKAKKTVSFSQGCISADAYTYTVYGHER
jgi:uncharacterized pyridoxal phosphate-containing UPF0001 family protein